ncbi:hypothetical protein [Nonomuraea roseoviolacea]|uniref:DUF8094 domain-containing protein n=2 Tax=Nonomuraea TaxID=83681 RepID=A0ABT1JVK0_9ACTN|nr:hypothetical protein [Nonomuraea roseoviolacea]MCP2345782.1 hypothetical protein [Nonomuraea roseoviolacea subsp. carminata]
MRASGRLRTLALAAGLLAGATACSGGSAAPPSASVTRAAVTSSATATPAPPPPEVTRAQAGEVFSTLTATDDVLRAAAPKLRDGTLRDALDLTRDAEAQLTTAAYQSTGYHPPRYEWGSPVLYVPRFPAGAESPWFTALVTRDGHPTLLTFARVNRGAEWQISAVTRLLDGQDPPPVQLDSEGYATALDPGDKSVTISPQYMGPLHATVAEAGATGVAAGLIAPGPYTTDLAEEISDERTAAKEDGLSYDSIFSGNDYPVYALRTRDGGALIQYSLSRNTTTTAQTNVKDFIPVPDDAQWAIDEPKVRRTLKLTETHQYATAVPPASAPAAARVIAHEGGLTRASGE